MTILDMRLRIHAILETIRQTLIAQAADAHAHYRQYDHYWDDWRVGVATQAIRTKLGQATERGDIVLVKPYVPMGLYFCRDTTFYSWRNQCNTGVLSGVRSAQPGAY